MTTPSSNASAPDRDRTHTVTDGSVRSTGPTDKSVDLDDQAMKSRLQRRMFGAGTTPPRIGKYRIERRVGAGGMGVVYEAYDDELERRVAVKLLHPELDEHHAIRMRREALALAKLSHPNVVHAYEIGLHESSLFLAMEFLAGEQLSKWQRAHRRQWKAVVAKYLDAGRGLAAAHAAGIVHRDFKPSNVVVCEDGTVRVLDFGLARSFGAVVGSEEGGALANMSALDARVTVTGTTMGTPAYMSPEQMLGQPTNAAADQFSFCVSLYEGLYGERPFGGDKAAQVYESVLFERLRPPPKGSSVPVQLRRIVLRGLRPKPEQRYASMADLLRALEGSTATGRWRPVVALGTLSAVPMFWLVAAAGPDCADGGGRAASLWDARRDAVATAISAPELGYGEATMAAVDERVDTYVGEWAAQHANACEIDDEPQRRKVLACLDNGLATLDRLAAVLESGGSGVVEQAAELVDELAPPDDCAGASIQSAHGDQLAELMSARLDAVAGRHEEARRRATAVLEVARSEQARGLAGEAFFTLALVELEAARYEPALDYFRSAAAEGLAGDAPLVVADAWIESARLQAWELGSLTASREHSANARAILEGLSDSGSFPGDREARLAWVDGRQAFTAQDVTLAVTRLREAVAGLVDAHDLRHTLVTQARLDLAHVLAEAGNTREAIETYDDARSAMVDLSGPHHPDLWAFDYGIALAHLDLGETENAKARLQAAFEVISDAGSARAEHRGQVLVALSRVYLAAGDNDRALETARSARTELRALPPDHLVRLGAENTVAVLLQRSGDLDGASEAFRSLAAGHEVGKDQRSAAEVWTQLVTLELQRARPGDASTILERHRDAVRERFGDAMTEALDAAMAALRELEAKNADAGRAHLERVRDLLSPEGHDVAMWCDLRAWATIVLAQTYADDDPARAKALAEEARSHLAASQHDPTLLAEAEALLHD